MRKREPPRGDEIRAVLFDLGGVVIDIDFERVIRRWSAAGGVSAASLRSRFRLDADYERHERGEIPVETYFASLRRSLGIAISDSEFLDGWNAIFAGVVPGIADLLVEASRAFPLYAFTNSNPAHQRTWSRHYAELLGCFERVFVSSELGRRKPELEAYAEVCAQMGVEAHRVLFFDDSAANVEGAVATGMRAVHVRSVEDVRESLRALGVTTD